MDILTFINEQLLRSMPSTKVQPKTEKKQPATRSKPLPPPVISPTQVFTDPSLLNAPYTLKQEPVIPGLTATNERSYTRSFQPYTVPQKQRANLPIISSLYK